MRVELMNVDKHFRKLHAVNDLSFTVEPGRVTGFLGPNGSGKSTTMRLMLGLDNGTGETLFDGLPLAKYKSVTGVVGAHLDAKFFHPKRSARGHLKMLGAEANISKARIDEVIQLVGLSDVARKRPGGFSLGMGQRLGLAGAILAQPKVLMLDEPANGLDPQSIHWLRDFLKHYASLGNTVLVSSHLLGEMQLLADDVVVIARGTLVAAESMQAFLSRANSKSVFVRSNDVVRLASVLSMNGFRVEIEGENAIKVIDATPERVGEIAFQSGVQLSELFAEAANLETVFMDLTASGMDYEIGAPVTGHDSAAIRSGESL